MSTISHENIIRPHMCRMIDRNSALSYNVRNRPSNSHRVRPLKPLTYLPYLKNRSPFYMGMNCFSLAIKRDEGDTAQGSYNSFVSRNHPFSQIDRFHWRLLLAYFFRDLLLDRTLLLKLFYLDQK